MSRSWVLVVVGAFFEVLWVIGLKHSANVISWIGTSIAIAVSLALIIRASFKLPVGTVYAVFTGLGTTLTVLVEMLVFGEPFKALKLLLIFILLACVLGLKLVTKESVNNGGRA